MGQVRLYVAVSIDGYIAAADGGVDWLAPYPAEQFGFDAFIATIGTVVMGRKTHDQARSFDTWPYAGKRTIVLTTRPLEPPHADVETWSGEIGPLCDALGKSRSDVWLVGGSSVTRAFLDARRIDRLELYVIPILLGSGIRLFAESPVLQQARLADATMLAQGVVRLTYDLWR